MTKPEIISELEKLEVSFDPKATKEELEALLEAHQDESVEKEEKKDDTIKQEDKPKFFIPEK